MSAKIKNCWGCAMAGTFRLTQNDTFFQSILTKTKCKVPQELARITAVVSHSTEVLWVFYLKLRLKVNYSNKRVWSANIYSVLLLSWHCNMFCTLVSLCTYNSHVLLSLPKVDVIWLLIVFLF